MAINARQWDKCEEVWLMLEPHFEQKATDRQKRLLAAGFCRNVSHLITPTRCLLLLRDSEWLYAFGPEPVPDRPKCLMEAIEEIEFFADEPIESELYNKLAHIADRLSFVSEYYFACYDASWGPIDYKLIASSEASGAVAAAMQSHLHLKAVARQAAVAVRASKEHNDEQADKEEERAQCDLVRDIFPTPGGAPQIDRSCVDSTILETAHRIYKAASFEQLPLLGEMLRENGCDVEEVLSHCNSPGPHVRGCWVVDWILGE